MDRQKSCGNDRLQVVMRAFHRYKYDKSYGVLLALIQTMRSDFFNPGRLEIIASNGVNFYG